MPHILERKRAIGDHASPQEGSGLGTAKGAEGVGVMPGNRREGASTCAPRSVTDCIAVPELRWPTYDSVTVNFGALKGCYGVPKRCYGRTIGWSW
jgi:hypothetical protein